MEVKQERDRIYAPCGNERRRLAIKVADLEVKYGEMDGAHSAVKARAGELLLEIAGIPLEQRTVLMSEVARGGAGNCVCCWRKRYSLTRTSCCSADRPATGY